MALVFSLLCVTDTRAEESTVTLAQWSYPGITEEASKVENDLPDTAGKKSGYVATAGAVTAGAIMTGSVDGSTKS